MKINEIFVDLSNASTDKFVNCSQSQIEEKNIDLSNDITANSLIDTSQSPTDYIIEEANKNNG